jgi:probable blue pigment (indigoidine) exporter
MEATWRWVLVTAVAPVAWGSTYYVTRQFLPADHPLYGAAIRALPAGLLLLLVCRALPRGSWWWRSLVLGVLNMSAFFALVYVAAQLLPASVASVIMATSSVVMMLIAWALLSERPGLLRAIGATVGVAGVGTMLLTGAGTLSVTGVAASVGAMLMSSFGYVLSRKWAAGVPVLAVTAWQLVAGGVVLVPVAVLVEGAPPVLDAPAIAGFAYVSVVGTAVAFAAWFTGLQRLDAGTVGLVGLLNPVTGVVLGTTLAAEALTGRQAAGIALVLAGILLGSLHLSQPHRARGTRRGGPDALGDQPGARTRPADRTFERRSRELEHRLPGRGSANTMVC